MCIIAYLTKNKLDKIDRTLDDLAGIKTEQAVMTVNINALQSDVGNLKTVLYSLGTERLVGKHEDIYTIPKRK